ncbi:MAG: HAMP domain-containing histidine kinase [Vampirovibrio sp.]|nr:HAMP domain-containing histidine kinase [Vampirovibrio sp.]
MVTSSTPFPVSDATSTPNNARQSLQKAFNTTMPNMNLYNSNNLGYYPFDELLGQLSGHSGLFSQATFQNLVSSLTRLVRDQRLKGTVLIYTPTGTADFETATLGLKAMQGVEVISLAPIVENHLATLVERGQLSTGGTTPLFSPKLGFILFLTERLGASVYWDTSTIDTFQLAQGGWSFNPQDVKTLATRLGEMLENEPLQSTIEQAPTDRRYDEKITFLVSSLVSNLEHRNRELSGAVSSLQTLNTQLVEQERLATIGQMSSTIAHEIRNPLGLIDLYASLVETQLTNLNLEALDPMVMKNLGQIRSSILHMESILSELTQYARPLELALQPINLKTFVEEVCDYYLPQFEANGITLTVEHTLNTAALPEVMWQEYQGDVTRLRQALINLLKNALEASLSAQEKEMANGIPSKPRSVTVGLSYRKDDRGLFLKVKDEGCGIAFDKREKLFTPYYSNKANGTGLGLAHVQKIMQAHHGGKATLLWSEPTKGSTFALVFPRHLTN